MNLKGIALSSGALSGELRDPAPGLAEGQAKGRRSPAYEWVAVVTFTVASLPVLWR